AQRHLDGWGRLAVPVAAQDRVAIVRQLRKGQRTVHVHDTPRALVLEQGDGLPRAHDEKVPVAAAAIPGRRAPAARTGVGEERPEGMPVEWMPCHARGTITAGVRHAQAANAPRAAARQCIAAWPACEELQATGAGRIGSVIVERPAASSAGAAPSPCAMPADTPAPGPLR